MTRGHPLVARLLGVYLAFWDPLTFALTASGALDRLVGYGIPALLLLVYRAGVAGLGVAAGRALWRGAANAPGFGRLWAILHALALVLTFATPYFPSNRLPGTKGLTLTLLVALDAAVWAWLRWSPGVRRAYEQ